MMQWLSKSTAALKNTDVRQALINLLAKYFHMLIYSYLKKSEIICTATVISTLTENMTHNTPLAAWAELRTDDDAIKCEEQWVSKYVRYILTYKNFIDYIIRFTSSFIWWLKPKIYLIQSSRYSSFAPPWTPYKSPLLIMYLVAKNQQSKIALQKTYHPLSLKLATCPLHLNRDPRQLPVKAHQHGIKSNKQGAFFRHLVRFSSIF